MRYTIQTWVRNIFQGNWKLNIYNSLFIENYENFTSKNNKTVPMKWWKIHCRIQNLVCLTQCTLSYLVGCREWHFYFTAKTVPKINNNEIWKIILTKDVISCLCKCVYKDNREVFWRQFHYNCCSLEGPGRNSKKVERIIEQYELWGMNTCCNSSKTFPIDTGSSSDSLVEIA